MISLNVFIFTVLSNLSCNHWCFWRIQVIFYTCIAFGTRLCNGKYKCVSRFARYQLNSLEFLGPDLNTKTVCPACPKVFLALKYIFLHMYMECFHFILFVLSAGRNPDTLIWRFIWTLPKKACRRECSASIVWQHFLWKAGWSGCVCSSVRLIWFITWQS